MELQRGQVVRSLAGHDQGDFQVVVAAAPPYAFVCDGKRRPLQRPKRKKRKHVQFVSRTDSLISGKILSGEPVLNSELRRALAVIGRNSPNQGG